MSVSLPVDWAAKGALQNLPRPCMLTNLKPDAKRPPTSLLNRQIACGWAPLRTRAAATKAIMPISALSPGIAYTPAGYQFLCAELTAQRVADYFAGLGASRVERFELPGIGALNFMLYDCLGGGASRSLRIDTQGKLLGTAALELLLPRPAELAQMERRQP